LPPLPPLAVITLPPTPLEPTPEEEPGRVELNSKSISNGTIAIDSVGLGLCISSSYEELRIAAEELAGGGGTEEEVVIEVEEALATPTPTMLPIPIVTGRILLNVTAVPMPRMTIEPSDS